MPDRNSNPYAGPRAFRVGEQIYGRRQETSQLANLLIAERIVLLCSPSGAGKTSLIQAALIPRLSKMKFRLLPIVRLNLNLPEAYAGKEKTNRYLYSTLLSLETSLPDGQQRSHSELAQMNLAEYLEQRSKTHSGPDVEVMIFDQFEEVLILDPTDLADKREFFNQLGQVLGVPNRWALFSMREEFVAALDPYVLPVPSRFKNRFRLDLLDREAALQAIQQPARNAGVEFEDAAAGKLVDDLRRVRVQRPDGSPDLQLGPYIEPVQLQVVCHRLWDALRQDAAQIREEDLAALGQVDQSLVDQSLADYYSERVAATANRTEANQREIRAWFDRQLITEQGLRGTVLMGTQSSGGLDNQAIRLLVDAHLVRAEKRGGSTWFELAHDRLIGPVKSDNAAWFKSNLNLLQQQAELWNRQGRPEGMLLRASELDEAERWAALHRSELLTKEADFLAASQSLNERERRARRLTRLILIMGILAMMLAVLAVLFAINANRSNLKAQAAEATAVLNEQAAEAAKATAQANFVDALRSQAGQLAALSRSSLEASPSRSLLLSIESLNTTQQIGELRLPSAEEALRAAVADPRGLALNGHQDWVWALDISPDGRWLATAGKDGTVRLWDLNAPDDRSVHVLQGHGDWIYNLDFSPDGRWLATASKDRTARLWDLQAGDTQASSIELIGHQDEVYAVAFSPDGRWLATGSKDNTVRLWDLGTTEPATSALELDGHTGWVVALAFSPDGNWLASGSEDETVRLWNTEDNEIGANPLILNRHDGPVQTVAFSPDGLWLASGSEDANIRLWDMKARDISAEPILLSGHLDPVNILAFSPDGRWLASGSGSRSPSDSRDDTARLWDLKAADPSANPVVLHGHEGAISSLAFSPDTHWLATGGLDHTVRLWDLNALDPVASARVLRGHDGWVFGLAFSPDGRLLASGGTDAMVRLWDLEADFPAIDPAILPHDNWVTTLSFSPDGYQLASAGAVVRLWQVDPPLLTTSLPHAENDLIRALAYSPDGRWLATGDDDGITYLWDLNSPDPAANPLELDHADDLVSSLAFSPDGNWLATGSYDHIVRLWNMNATDPAANMLLLTGHQDAIYKVAFSPDGRWLASASKDQTARLWDLSSPDQSANTIILNGHQGDVFTLAFSPDGRWLATGSFDRTIRLWDLNAGRSGNTSEVLQGHQDVLNALAFSPDGRWLASGSRDQTVRLWDLSLSDPNANPKVLGGYGNAIYALAFSADGSVLATGSADGNILLWELDADGPIADPVVLRGHDGAVFTLAFSPDGHWLVTGSQDRTVRRWNLRLDELMAMACQNAGRNFTQDEWRQYFPGIDYHRTCTEWGEGR